MYHVTLVNLSADARTAAVSLSPVERRGVGPDEMRALLANFCAVDPVENAAADPEMRIRTRHESYLVRLGNRTLVFYDIQRRDLPAQLLGVDAVMAELDGSADSPSWAAWPPRWRWCWPGCGGPIRANPWTLSGWRQRR